MISDFNILALIITIGGVLVINTAILADLVTELIKDRGGK